MEARKNKPILVLAIFVAIAVLVAVLVVIFVVIRGNNRREIDCMPPMSASEQDCLDKGECYCATF